MLTAKETYREFCATSKRPLVFQTPLWLDTIVGDENWDVALSFNGNFLSGALPYVTNSRLGIKQITLPVLTPYLGPIIFFPSDLKQENHLSHKRKVILNLIESLPATDRFITQTDFDFDYWLPFYWNGFSQTTRYSYLLETNQDQELIFKGFKSNIKKQIKKTEQVYTMLEAHATHTLFELYQADFKRKKEPLVFSNENLDEIYRALKPHSNCKVIHAIDSSSKVVAAFLLVFDHKYAHYLVGAVDENHRNSGVMSLLMWESIREAKKRNLIFNFEGSMNKRIEQFFTAFGGTPTPYMQISKTSNKYLKHFTKFTH